MWEGSLFISTKITSLHTLDLAIHVKEFILQLYYTYGKLCMYKVILL